MILMRGAMSGVQVSPSFFEGVVMVKLGTR